MLKLSRSLIMIACGVLTLTTACNKSSQKRSQRSAATQNLAPQANCLDPNGRPPVVALNGKTLTGQTVDPCIPGQPPVIPIPNQDGGKVPPSTPIPGQNDGKVPPNMPIPGQNDGKVPPITGPFPGQNGGKVPPISGPFPGQNGGKVPSQNGGCPSQNGGKDCLIYQ